MATKYSGPTAGDLVVHEESQQVCRESIAVINPVAAAYTAPIGAPLLADGTIAVATEEASVVGLLTEEVALAASGTSPLPKSYIARGPAVINENKILAVDPAGADYTVATIVSALEALGMVVRAEPADVAGTQIN